MDTAPSRSDLHRDRALAEISLYVIIGTNTLPIVRSGSWETQANDEVASLGSERGRDGDFVVVCR